MDVPSQPLAVRCDRKSNGSTIIPCANNLQAGIAYVGGEHFISEIFWLLEHSIPIQIPGSPAELRCFIDRDYQQFRNSIAE